MCLHLLHDNERFFLSLWPPLFCIALWGALRGTLRTSPLLHPRSRASLPHRRQHRIDPEPSTQHRVPSGAKSPRVRQAAPRLCVSPLKPCGGQAHTPPSSKCNRGNFFTLEKFFFERGILKIDKQACCLAFDNRTPVFSLLAGIFLRAPIFF